MKNIKEDTKILDIIMPASHDAGVWNNIIQQKTNVLKRGFKVKTVQVAAQEVDLYMQADRGSRFFDCRAFKSDVKEIIGGKKVKTFRMGHFPGLVEKPITKGLLKYPTLGGYGDSLEMAFDQLERFVTANPTEFVVMRFSHTPQPKECIDQIERIFNAKPSRLYRYLLRSNMNGYKDNIAEMEIKHLRGKIVLIFDTEFKSHITSSRYTRIFHNFLREANDTDIYSSGLMCCGKKSFAGKEDMGKVWDAVGVSMENHGTHCRGNDIRPHLHFIYWQLTASVGSALKGKGNIHKNTKATIRPPEPTQSGPLPGRTGGTHANMPNLMNKVRDTRLDKQIKVPVNIVSFDFVNRDMCSMVVRQNIREVLKNPDSDPYWN